MKKLSSAFGLMAAIALSGPIPSSPGACESTIKPSHLMDTENFGYSQGAIVRPGVRTIHISGRIGISENEPNDFKSQVDRAFDNLLAVLRVANGHVSDIVKITMLVKSHDEEKMRYLVEKRRRLFGDSLPASTVIPVTTLGFGCLGVRS